MGLIVSALAAVSGFLALFSSFSLIFRASCLPGDPDLALISPRADMLLVIACLALAWLIAFLQKDAFSLRYVGTMFYGREETDQGYVTTKWLTFVFPLLPVRSYLVTGQIKEISNNEIQFQRNRMENVEGLFHLPQVLRTAAISYGTLLWCSGCLWLMLNSTCLQGWLTPG